MTDTPVPDVRELARRTMQQAVHFDANANCDGCNDAADAVLAAVEPVIRRQERAKVAEEIRAHADRHAPLAGHGVPAPLRRHLRVAARIAAGPMTVEEAAQAFAAAIARSHSTQPTEEETNG